MLLDEVRNLDGIADAQNGLACWDLKNNSGELLSPGIYYLRAIVDGKTYFSKFTLI